MKTIPTTPFNGQYGGASCLFISIILILIVAAGLFTLQSYLSNGNDAPQSTEEDARFDLEEVRPGWWETRKFIYFDIPARVVFKLPEKDGPDPRALSVKIWDEFERIGKIFNPFDSASETARLNRPETHGATPVSRDMHAVLSLSRELWEASNGAFDPTTLPLKRMWEAAVQSQQIPTNREIMRTMEQVGFDNLEITTDREQVKLKNRHAQFDFGGIAKGYAVDQVSSLLREQGIPAALVALSGEIRAYGDNNGEPWRIGIQNPIKMNGLWGIVSSDGDIRVSTSGNYRQPLRIAGREFYHIFNPRTGRPVSEQILGVTTLCTAQKASNALLDGAATAIVVMGTATGIPFAESAGIEALVIKRSRDGKIEEVMTSGFKRLYEPAPKTE